MSFLDPLMVEHVFHIWKANKCLVVLSARLTSPIGSKGDSHHPNKVNFSLPCTPIVPSIEVDPLPNSSHVPHVTTAIESNCDISQWHIVRLCHKSSCKCHTQQRGSNILCKARIAKGTKGTPTRTYHGRKKQWGGNKEIVTDFWFV